MNTVDAENILKFSLHVGFACPTWLSLLKKMELVFSVEQPTTDQSLTTFPHLGW